MKWPVPLLLGYLLLALESPLREALRLGSSNAAPSLIIPFVAFIALMAPATPALWTALIVGLVIDLTTLRGDSALVIAGPHALGCLAATYLLMRLRPMVVRRSPIAVTFMSVLAHAVMSVVVVTVLGVRRMIYFGAWSDGTHGALASDLWQRLLGSLYTGVAGLVLAGLFMLLTPYFGFQDSAARVPYSRK